MKKGTWTTCALLISASFLLGGCSDGGDRRLPITASAPSSGGATTSTPVSATPVTGLRDEDVYRDFSPFASLADIEIPAVKGLTDRAFVVEDGGTIQILELTATDPVLDRTVEVVAGGLPSGVGAGDLTILAPDRALLVTSGKGGEAVYRFNPSTVSGPGDFEKVEIPDPVYVGSAQNSAGKATGPFISPSFTASATVADGRLFICTSNLDTSTFDYDPGTLLVFELLSGGGISNSFTVIPTSSFNPSSLIRLESDAGEEIVACLCAGPFGGTEGAIDLIDARTLRRMGSIPLAANASGEMALSPDGKRLFVGSQNASELYQVDVSDLDAVLAVAQTGAGLPDLSARALNDGDDPIDVPVRSGTQSNYISNVALSHDGAYVYAVNFNDTTLTILGRNGNDLTVFDQVGFERQAAAGGFENNAYLVGVRPGIKGVDYQGRDLYVGTVNLATSARKDPDVEVTLDGVETK